jgi:predicted transcriptional regulator
MYTYIMQRTQIYLSEDETRALDREARRRGTTRSHLIREAVRERYLRSPEIDLTLSLIDTAAGVWADHAADGEAYVDGMRTGTRWETLYPNDVDE